MYRIEKRKIFCENSKRRILNIIIFKHENFHRHFILNFFNLSLQTNCKYLRF